MVHIEGDCTLTLGDQPLPCRAAAYMVFPSSRRINFTAVTDADGWSFSGEQDQNDEDGYVLALDSVITPSAGRVDAEGECDMQVGEDGRSVESLRCEAATDDGVLVLEASGMITVDDADDGDDEDGPEHVKG